MILSIFHYSVQLPKFLCIIEVLRLQTRSKAPIPSLVILASLHLKAALISASARAIIA